MVIRHVDQARDAYQQYRPCKVGYLAYCDQRLFNIIRKAEKTDKMRETINLRQQKKCHA